VRGPSGVPDGAWVTDRLILAVPAPRYFEGWVAGHAGAGPPASRHDIAAREPASRTRAHYEALLAELAHRRVDERPVWFLIRRTDGALAGTVTLFDVVRGDSQSGMVGYHVFNHLTGQGLATEAVGALVELGFAPLEAGGLGLHRLVACIEPDNRPSLRVVERCGFRFEGLARRRIRRAGAWRDTRIYALTVEDRGRVWQPFAPEDVEPPTVRFAGKEPSP